MPLLFSHVTIEKKQTDVKGKMAPVTAIQDWQWPFAAGRRKICGNLFFRALKSTRCPGKCQNASFAFQPRSPTIKSLDLRPGI